MRQFVCISHDVPLDGDFTLDDLAGGAGRLDLLCRAITSALLLSHQIRSDVRVHLVIQNTVTITLDGNNLRHLHPDERSTAALIRNALSERDEAIGSIPAEPSPGILLYRRSLHETLSSIADDGTLIHLHEDGTPLPDIERPDDPIFILSDHRDFSTQDSDTITSFDPLTVAVSPVALHTDQAITISHHYLDTRGYRRW